MNDDSANEFSRELQAGMPSPRDDEPASLRQNIVDELADHLACAHQREQLFIGDGTAASDQKVNERVLSRFGSPVVLARRLWFDWMWEKIAMQRTTQVLMIALVACCGAMVAMVWQANQATQAALSSAQETHAAVLVKLTELSNSPTVSQPPDWNPLKIRLFYDDDERTPVEGAEIQISGKTEDTKRIPSSTETTDHDGLADFGMVLFGEYIVTIIDPKSGNNTSPVIAVRPGQDKVHEFVCPQSGTLNPKLKIVKPTGLFGHEFHEKDLWCRVSCRYGDIFEYSVAPWSSHPPKEEYDVTFWITPFRSTISAQKFDEITEQVEDRVEEICAFPAETYQLPEKIPQEGVSLYRGDYQVDRVELFEQRTTKEGTNYIVGTPRIPLKSFVRNRHEADDHMMSMGGDEYGTYDDGSMGGGFGAPGAEMSAPPREKDPLRDYLNSLVTATRTFQFSAAFNYSFSNFIVSENIMEQQNIRLNQMDVCLFSLAAQVKENQKLVVIDAISKESFPLKWDLTPVEILDDSEKVVAKAKYLTVIRGNQFFRNYQDESDLGGGGFAGGFGGETPANVFSFYPRSLIAIDAKEFDAISKANDFTGKYAEDDKRGVSEKNWIRLHMRPATKEAEPAE